MRREIEEQIHAASLEQQIEMPGLMPRERVLEEYRRARLFVLPCVVTPRGDRDGLPNVVAEAMAMGLPVVATDMSALPEAVVDGETGRLVAQRDPQALAHAIETLWDDAATRARMSRAAKERVRTRFALTDNIERLAAFVKGMG